MPSWAHELERKKMNDHPDLKKVTGEINGFSVQQILREFFRNSEYGTPDNISQVGCIALVDLCFKHGGEKQGHVVWNAWRRQFPVHEETSRNIVNFEKHEFREHPYFNNFEFGIRANFRKTFFLRGASFIGAHFGTSCDFSYAYWLNAAWFQFSRWDSDIRFNHAYWNGCAEFMGSQWRDADFDNAVAANDISFRGASWADRINFSGCNFFNSFEGSAASWEWLKSKHFTFDKDDVFTNAMSHAKEIGSDPTTFSKVVFSGASFKNKADFSNRKFLRGAKFDKLKVNGKQVIRRTDIGLPSYGPNKTLIFDNLHLNKDLHVTFGSAPLFHGCELHQDTSFDGATFPKPTGDKDASRAYETLKLAFSKQQAVRAEQDFFRLEMDEETRREKRLKWLAFWLYNLFSDYGFSIGRPLLLLLASTFWFAWIKGDLSNPSVCWITDSNCTLLIKESLALGLSLPGLDAGSKVSYQAQSWFGFLLLHKVISLAALFLMGLALRNLFKFK